MHYWQFVSVIQTDSAMVIRSCQCGAVGSFTFFAPDQGWREKHPGDTNCQERETRMGNVVWRMGDEGETFTR
jgi:hypothetical protein